MPSPADGERHLAGLPLASVTSSCARSAGTSGCTTSTSGDIASSDTAREILLRVVRQLPGEQAWIDHERAVDHPDGAAVGRSGRDRLADLARAAAAICRRRKIAEARRDAAGSAAPGCRRPARRYGTITRTGAADSPAPMQTASARRARGLKPTCRRFNIAVSQLPKRRQEIFVRIGAEAGRVGNLHHAVLDRARSWHTARGRDRRRSASSATSFCFAARMCSVAR